MNEPEAFVFSVWGTPRPKSRPRFVKGKVISTATDKEKLWKGAVERVAFCAAVARGDPMPLFRTGPVAVRMVFNFRPPESELNRIGQAHTFKPDADNLEKLVLDAMKKVGVFKDDSQVAKVEVSKQWGERSGVTILVEQASPTAQAPNATGEAPPDWLSC